MSANPFDIRQGPTSVLVLEDFEKTLHSIHALVEEVFPSASVTKVRSCEKAMALIPETSFDLAFVDLGLPDGSGHDVIQRLSQYAPHTYVVVASIIDDDRDVIRALQNGANGYLLKDESRELIKSHLMGIGESRPPLSSRALDMVLMHISRSADLQTTHRGRKIALTPREEEVLQLVGKGYNVTESASLLGLTTNTVKSYLKSIYGKLGISSRAEATAEAIKRQLIDF